MKPATIILGALMLWSLLMAAATAAVRMGTYQPGIRYEVPVPPDVPECRWIYGYATDWCTTFRWIAK